MKTYTLVWKRSLLAVASFMLVCGVLYTGLTLGLAQLFFPAQANGSRLTGAARAYGSTLIGQQFSQPTHLWGRPVSLNVTDYKDAAGHPVVYAGPSNLSPASTEYAQLVAKRVARLQAAHPERGSEPVPVDLVTESASGLDPHISPAAAEYQLPRLLRTTHKTEAELRAIIDKCTTERFLGIFGERTVNVKLVNLYLDNLL